MWEKIKDFFYYFFDIILAILIIGGISFVIYTNLDYLINLDHKDINANAQVEEKKEEDLLIDVDIPKDIKSEDLAILLESYGLINDKKDFEDKLNNYKKDSEINTGNFKIKSNIAMDDLIKILK